MRYQDAGVSIDNANHLTALIKDTVHSDSIGMFAGLYEHKVFPDHYLVACTDGVGTKVIPLVQKGLLDTVAKDLIAMNLNDMICTGALPLFFLDYIATNKLDVETASTFIKCLKANLDKYNCTLLGGETAELNDLITEGHFDVGGFAVGIVSKQKILRKDSVQKGNILVGLRSSGPHSNGFTLIRKLFDNKLISERDFLNSLNPTYIYVNEILKLVEHDLINCCANITGGGISDNLERIIPQNLCAKVYTNRIPQTELFKNLESAIGFDEAYKTFNMGVGMILVVENSCIDNVFDICNQYEPFILGEIEEKLTSSPVIMQR